MWVAERDGRSAGRVAIVAASARTAQLRWFLVDPEFRGAGLGTTLLDQAVAFSREQEYGSIVLWTVSALAGAGRLYRKAGFRKVEECGACRWGVPVVEEKYKLLLDEP